MKQSNVAMTVGALVFSSLATVTTTANANPFTAIELASGYEMVAGEGKCGEDKAKKAKDKVKEAKCGEGKCGEDKMKAKASKAKEGKCGEGKCGEAKCGADKAKEAKDKAKEGKCGEGKCGEGKCGGSV
ncbi:putative low-complexity protein [Rheinheimera pacifica]|uniref:HvfA family oxazolone/thioamide-modified RiPP metallophore n=1 Tax=Rheinheimera pacifica TaxID=173990 RepID=UPI002167BC3D|nr:hypothetical protein [Rheinheimera pacifica]MCS4305758.1 putative low-complexity protein [Rheinheimera pacifica]